MKLLRLDKVELQTLREMGVFHSHPRTRIRAQAIVRLSQGLTLQQTADKFHVHLTASSNGGSAGTSRVWLDCTRGIIPAEGGNGRPSNKMHCARWPKSRAEAPILCCVACRPLMACRPSARRRQGVTCATCVLVTSVIAKV